MKFTKEMTRENEKILIQKESSSAETFGGGENTFTNS